VTCWLTDGVATVVASTGPRQPARFHGNANVGSLVYRFILITNRPPLPGANRTVKFEPLTGTFLPSAATVTKVCSA